MALKQLVFADESGTHDNSTYCIIAGYRASRGQWKIFDRNWRGVLQKYRVPEFHSKIFFNRKRITSAKRNPYLSWTDSRATEFLGELLKVISGRRIYPVGCSVGVPDFDSFSYGERCVLAGYQAKRSRRESQRPQPYHLAFRLFLGDALEATDPDTEVNFVLADQVQYRQRAYEAYDLTKRLGQTGREGQMKGIAFKEPIDCPGLQAADLVAHQWYNTSVRMRKGERLNRQNIATMNVLAHKRNEMPHCDANSMERMFDDAGVSAHARQQLQAIEEPE